MSTFEFTVITSLQFAEIPLFTNFHLFADTKLFEKQKQYCKLQALDFLCHICMFFEKCTNSILVLDIQAS